MGEELLQSFINFCLKYMANIKLPRKRSLRVTIILTRVCFDPVFGLDDFLRPSAGGRLLNSVTGC